MPRFKDRTGDKYGRLTVLSHAGKDHRNKHLWLCMCDCGNKRLSHLTTYLAENQTAAGA